MSTPRALLASLATVFVGLLLAAAGGTGGQTVGGVSVFTVCVLLAFAVNWVVFVPSWLAQTEHYYDLAGSIANVAVIGCAVVLSDTIDMRRIVLAVMVGVWGVRLGWFLFRRVKVVGKDGRFDDIKKSFARYLFAWTMQGLWVVFTQAAAIAAITSTSSQPFGVAGFVGSVVWLTGFGIEVVADWQKSTFRSDPANRGKFISTGLWAWSRHPNYFGEILLWVGIAILAVPVLQGWQTVTLLSPVFVYVLLTRISGLPMLEQRADDRWGGSEQYETYKATTPTLILKPPR